MYTGAPRLGSTRWECYFCMSAACVFFLRWWKKSDVSYRGWAGLMRMQGRWNKKIKLRERGRLCLSVIIFFLCHEDVYRGILDGENEDKKKS